MTKRIKVFLWIAIGAAVVAAFAITAERRLRPKEVESIEAVQSAEGVPVDYVVARAARIADWRAFVGVAEGFHQIDLTADYRTRVSAVHAAVGEEVTKGRVIVSLDQYDPTRIMVNLETARAQYGTARRDSVRMEELYKSGAVSEQQLDNARAEAVRARASYNTARRAVQLDSPITGMVTALYVEGGDYAEAAEILATVASLDRMRIPLDVGSAERRLIKVGQEVRLPLARDLGAGVEGSSGLEFLMGTVANVSLSADPETRLYRVDLVLENPDHVLKPGAPVTPEIKVAWSDSGTVVPRTALLEQSDGKSLYVVAGSENDRRAELRGVRAGLSSGPLVAVEDGLAPGEWVVVWGQGKLKDGIKIALHDDITSEYFGLGTPEGRSR